MNAKIIFDIGVILIVVLNLAGLIRLYRKLDVVRDKLNTVEYVLFVGLNDKDTSRQEISDDVAITIIRSILAKYANCYTFLNAQGAWAYERGKETSEKTIICYISDVDEAVIHRIADELIEALNQRTILIKKNLTFSEYHEGKADKSDKTIS